MDEFAPPIVAGIQVKKGDYMWIVERIFDNGEIAFYGVATYTSVGLYNGWHELNVKNHTLSDMPRIALTTDELVGFISRRIQRRS